MVKKIERNDKSVSNNSLTNDSSIDIESVKEELTSYMKEKIDSEISDLIEKNSSLSSIKDDLSVYMKSKIDIEAAKATEFANKKIIRYKNGIIIKRDIIIVLLLIICFFLGYNLYNVSNIKINITRELKNSSVKKNSETKKEENISESNSDLSDKIKEYEHFIKEISVNEDSSYLKDFYEGNLTDEVRLYIAFNNLDSSSEDGDTIYVDEKDLKDEHNSLFDIDYVAKTFKYNDFIFKYLSSKEMYLATGKLKKNGTAIKKEITDIKDDDNLVITTVEGIVSKDKLYNILDKKEISDYKGDSLINYSDSLIKLEYYFNKVDGEYKLSKISVL